MNEQNDPQVTLRQIALQNSIKPHEISYWSNTIFDEDQVDTVGTTMYNVECRFGNQIRPSRIVCSRETLSSLIETFSDDIRKFNQLYSAESQ